MTRAKLTQLGKLIDLVRAKGLTRFTGFGVDMTLGTAPLSDKQRSAPLKVTGCGHHAGQHTANGECLLCRIPPGKPSLCDESCAGVKV